MSIVSKLLSLSLLTIITCSISINSFAYAGTSLSFLLDNSKTRCGKKEYYEITFEYHIQNNTNANQTYHIVTDFCYEDNGCAPEAFDITLVPGQRILKGFERWRSVEFKKGDKLYYYTGEITVTGESNSYNFGKRYITVESHYPHC